MCSARFCLLSIIHSVFGRFFTCLGFLTRITSGPYAVQHGCIGLATCLVKPTTHAKIHWLQSINDFTTIKLIFIHFLLNHSWNQKGVTVNRSPTRQSLPLFSNLLFFLLNGYMFSESPSRRKGCMQSEHSCKVNILMINTRTHTHTDMYRYTVRRCV